MCTTGGAACGVIGCDVVQFRFLGISLAGYLFGNIPWVKANLDKIIWALIIVPGLIAIFGAWKARRKAAAEIA